jgi:ribonuclease T
LELKDRFRGYLPVALDLETGGFEAVHNPLLEVACSFFGFEDQLLSVKTTHAWSVVPFEGSTVDPASLKFTGIDLQDRHPPAVDERAALSAFFKLVRAEMKVRGCHRAVMVAHNAAFDAGFLNAACVRQNVKRNPFHPFTTIDTAALGAVAYGHTVLRVICRRAGIDFENDQAHRAAYDVERTAQVFCRMVNGWPLNTASWSVEDSDS